ncbi:hypothetical protein GEMRC1_002973 [Eukaryota sp. GEM-RC1]
MNTSSVICCSPSIFGEAPLFDIEREVAEFIYRHCDKPYVEIEAKLGVLISKKTHQRFAKDIPTINSEAVVFSDPSFVHPYHFLTAIPTEVFERINISLNERHKQSQVPGYGGSPIHVRQFIERDWIFGKGEKVRASVDSGGNIIKCIKKVRVEDLNFVSKHHGLDWRLSASLEEPCAHPNLDNIREERRKHRISYFFELWRFDLTRVEIFKNEELQDTTYQVELEIRDIQSFVKRKAEISAKVTHEHDDPPLHLVSWTSFLGGTSLTDLTRAFVNNVRGCISLGGHPDEEEF